MVINNGIVPLSSVFHSAFPGITYTAYTAKKRLLQLPLVAIRLGVPATGKSQLYVMEYIHGLNYVRVAQFLENSGAFEKTASTPNFTREELKQLLGIAQSDREKECLRYAVYRASGLTPSASRRYFGFEKMDSRAKRVEDCLKDAQVVRGSIEELSITQERAVLKCLGVDVSDSGSEDDCRSTDDSDSEVGREMSQSFKLPDLQHLSSIVRNSRFNWFEIMDTVAPESEDQQNEHLVSEHCFAEALKLDLNDSETKLLQNSYDAFCEDFRTRTLCQRKADALNGLIVSDSDTDDPEQYVGLSLSSDRLRGIVAKRRRSIERRKRYLVAKSLAERNYLGRKCTKSVKGIVKQFPDIGKVIETYVQERNVGADAWRRTGLLTFDGNCRVKEKVTHKRIQTHLQEVYRRKFSYGTVVQLCVARNRRHRSSQRYKGVAQVTCRRARKGFALRYNPDKHWSSALYRGLNHFQLTDGRKILNVNRDDASGFRLDTMATHRLQRTPCVRGKQALTTYTDYVNHYPSTLQTTSYNFTGTKTTGELCAGVVKAAGVFQKNPAQHAADLEMLQSEPSFQIAFVDPESGCQKPVECIRVDGASDEGPGHEEVQFHWTSRHLECGNFAMLVSSRNSGASYLNRVELQNGCLALGHANLFIPSTLGGSCLDPETGKVDREKFRCNMDMATDVYLSRVNGSPCGETEIQLFKGANSSSRQETRAQLLQYLKGSKKQRESLQLEFPSLYAYFEKVWTVRNNHMTKGLPTQYLFYLLCSNCRDSNCAHPVCQSGVYEVPKWYENGPSITYLPLPVPDTSRPWGSQCAECSGVCYGHFLKPMEAFMSSSQPMSKPPSATLDAAFKKLKGRAVSESDIDEVAKATLLPPEEVKIWFAHLDTVAKNRQRGARKAAETRRMRQREKQKQASGGDTRQSADVYYCGVCHQQYVEYTETVQMWIGCDVCDKWYHYSCVGLTSEPESFLCERCT